MGEEKKKTKSVVLLFSPREKMRSIITAGLIHGNYGILEAATSYIAGVKANQYLPDLVIVDITQSNIKDFLFLTRLERSIRTKDIPVIISVTPQVHKAIDKIHKEVMPLGEEESKINIIEFPFHFSKFIKLIESILKDKQKKEKNKNVLDGDSIGESLFDSNIPVHKKLRQIEKIMEKQWAFPFTVVRALNIINTDSSCCRELAKCIETDMAIATAILRVANTVFYAKSKGRVSDVSEAIVRVGFNETRNLISCLSLIELSKGICRQYGFTRSDFWAHSLSTAIISEKLYTNGGGEHPELAFIAGLIHDLGKIPLDNNFSHVFPVLLEETTNRILPFHEAEQKLMGFTHGDLGHFFTTNWNFPSSITLAILNHHKSGQIIENPVYSDRLLQSSVYAGNILAKAMSMGHSCDEILQDIPVKMSKDLKIMRGPASTFFDKIYSRFRRFYDYLELSESEVSIKKPYPVESGMTVFIVYGSNLDYHPVESALKNNGYEVRPVKSLPEEAEKQKNAALFILDKESTLDITIESEEKEVEKSSRLLKIFFLEGLELKEPKKEFNRSNIVLMDRKRLDLRLVLHVIEDFNLAASMQAE